MWMRLRNLFSPAKRRKSPKRRPAVGASDTIRSMPTSTRASNFASEEIRSSYFGLILGVHSLTDDNLNRFESEVGRRLKKLLKSKESRSELVPRLPAIVPKLMCSLRDDNVSGADLARQIGKDATLVAETIRIANSPYYRTVNKIQSLEQAVSILGHKGIHNLLASAAFKPILNSRQGHFTNLASGWVWRQSEYCALSAQYLAKILSVDPFEAYLAGLVRDTGTVVALRVMDRMENVDDAPRSTQFQQLFSKQALQLSALIAHEWELPDTVVQSIKDQLKAPVTEEMSNFGTVLQTATLISQVQILIEEQRVEEDLKEFTCHTEGRLTSRCRRCFDELKKYAS